VLGIIELIRSRVLTRLGTRLDAELGERVFAAAVADRLAGSGGAAAQPLRDLETLRGFVTGGALPVLFDAPWAPFFVAVTFLLHPWLGLVALLGAIVLLLIGLVNEARTRRLSNDAAGEALAAGGFAESVLRNAEAVAAMGVGPAAARRWRALYDLALAQQLRAAERNGGAVGIRHLVLAPVVDPVLRLVDELALAGRVVHQRHQPHQRPRQQPVEHLDDALVAQLASQMQEVLGPGDPGGIGWRTTPTISRFSATRGLSGLMSPSATASSTVVIAEAAISASCASIALCPGQRTPAAVRNGA
jgi:hypothetical protein